MNWTRKELKSAAKLDMRKNYWKTVFLSLVMLILSEITTYRVILEANEELPKTIRSVFQEITSRVVDVKLVIVLITLSVSIVLLNTIMRIGISVFLKNPIEVGAARFLLKTADAGSEEEKGMVADMLYAFDHGYINVIKVLFFRELSILLRLLLLIVPGIVRMYQLRMLPYLLSKDSTMTTKEAMEVSREMMKGQKWKAFLLDMSFIPWHLLGILTLGVAEVLYVLPLMKLTGANLYNTLQEVYIEKQSKITDQADSAKEE